MPRGSNSAAQHPNSTSGSRNSPSTASHSKKGFLAVPGARGVPSGSGSPPGLPLAGQRQAPRGFPHPGCLPRATEEGAVHCGGVVPVCGLRFAHRHETGNKAKSTMG